jgi:manganese oxidase
MNAFDTNFDGDNEVYAVNTAAHFHMAEPIRVELGKLVRIYLVNVTEFDLINSLHLHGMFFKVNRTGTALEATEVTDTLMLCQGERSIVETTFRYPGLHMFHAHQSEFAELGWMGLFEAA